MIVLGEKYRFHDWEIKRILHNYGSLDVVPYHDQNTEHVIQKIRDILGTRTASIIVLNTESKVPSDLIRFLTSLQVHNVAFTTIEAFLEHNLHKFYIPPTGRDLSYLAAIQPYSRLGFYLKRALDYGASILLLILAVPLMLYSIYRIKKESPGAAFFAQTRIGKSQKPFTCYKFRTMHENAHHDPYTRERDDRIFPWGFIMRKYRIDELPQLWNILKGEMHLVGPRAEWDILVKEYDKIIPYYHQRHVVAPGITGWAQVHYPYGADATDAHQKLMYDLYYIKHWTPWLEIQTIIKTTAVVLGAKGR